MEFFDYIQTSYPSIFSYSFFSCFFLLLVWEQSFVWIKPSNSLIIRWWNAIFLSLFNKLLTPISVISIAVYAGINSIGIFNVLSLNSTVTLILGCLLYDMYQYLLHRLFHKIPFLWRLHRVHHSDPDVDISTDLRHHPLESLVTVIFSIIFVLVFGLSPIVIIMHSLFSQIISLFSHANIKLPKRIDRLLRIVIITPAMHRIHHSSYQPETDSNYGALFSFWDRLFKTYTDNPKMDYENMQFGLHCFRSKRELWLDKLLFQPFYSK